MASRKTVTLDNLMALGPERLAVILVELADGNAEVKRRLRLELAAQEGGDNIAAEIGKRITALRSARSFVDWQKRREFVRDLDQQRAMIADRVAPIRPDLALDLMWRFLNLAEPVLNRVDDSTGSVGDVFRLACGGLGGAGRLPGMANKVAEYRRTAQLLKLLAEQAQFPDTGEQLRRLAANFEALADRVASWEQKEKASPANAA
jgi:hypothetical protein